MLKTLSQDMPFSKRLILSNLWLSKPVLVAQFSKNDVSNALIRTTFATTVINGGVKDNVLPIQANATANIRIIPGDTVQSVLEQIKSVINDPRVKVTVKGNLAVDSQLMLSSTDSFGFKMIKKTVNQLFPSVLVTPSQLTAITDSGNYKNLTDDLYRFQPTWLTNMRDARRIHGIDERSSLADLERFVQFYTQLIVNSSSN